MIQMVNRRYTCNSIPWSEIVDSVDLASRGNDRVLKNSQSMRYGAGLPAIEPLEWVQLPIFVLVMMVFCSYPPTLPYLSQWGEYDL